MTICIMCGLPKVQAKPNDYENGNFEMICEDCYADYQEELAENMRAMPEIERKNFTDDQLPF